MRPWSTQTHENWAEAFSYQLPMPLGTLKRMKSRIYRATFRAEDGSGGSCMGAVTVCVPHNYHEATCTDDGQLHDSTQP